MNALTQSLLACVRGVLGSIPPDQLDSYYDVGLKLKYAVIEFYQKTRNDLPQGTDSSTLEMFFLHFMNMAENRFPDPPPPTPVYTQYPPGYFGSYPRRRKTRRNRTR